MPFVLLVAFVWVVGCAAPKPMPIPDAVKGWKCHNANLDPPNYQGHSQLFPYYHIDQAIIDDYQAYAHSVWPKGEDFFISEVDFYEDGTGKHAVRIELEPGPSGYIDYYLMYDTNNVRTEVIEGKTWYPFHM